MNKFIYNESSCKQEKAFMKQCPRCKGYGSNAEDDDGCYICNGYGQAWITSGGWTLAPYSRGAGQLY